MKKEIEICGEYKELFYDKKVKILNLELAKDSIGSPIIIFQDWTKKNKSKELFRVHIKEAIEIKAIIDNLIIDYYEELLEKSIEELKSVEELK